MEQIRNSKTTASILIYCSLGFLLLFPFSAFSYSLTDDQIKQMIIQEYISKYPGPCACPYSRGSNGHKCGQESAWRKSNSPNSICFVNEVTPTMIKSFKRNFNNN